MHPVTWFKLICNWLWVWDLTVWHNFRIPIISVAPHVLQAFLYRTGLVRKWWLTAWHRTTTDASSAVVTSKCPMGSASASATTASSIVDSYAQSAKVDTKYTTTVLALMKGVMCRMKCPQCAPPVRATTTWIPPAIACWFLLNAKTWIHQTSTITSATVAMMDSTWKIISV